ncbi:MAG: PE-PPE domain-containing protein, partial [Mycobacterium sp.]
VAAVADLPVAEPVVEAVADLPVAEPVVAPIAVAAPADAVADLLPVTGEAVDASAGTNPTVPADSPLSWTMLAAARRDPLTASAVAAPLPPVPIPGGCTQTSTACALIFGPSGVPVPTGRYALNAQNLYLNQFMPAGYDSQIVFSPEGAYPVTGIKNLALPISANQGLQILINTLQVLQPDNTANPIPITIFGFSQSAVISSLLQRELEANPDLLPGVDRSQLSFVTVGQEMSPNGGWFARFPGFNTPSLGEFFYGSTGYASATDTGAPQFAYPTVNYTLEYDGFADSPRYPLNFLSALNAAMGILFTHINYNSPNYFTNTYGTDPIAVDGPAKACADGSSSYCSELPVAGSPDQKYYFIQTPDLPLLAPLRLLPLIGNPLADLIQPVLKVIVDLGYGDPAHGFTSATQPDANVALPFGLFPDVNPAEILTRLVDGVGQGVSDFFGAFGPNGSVQQEISSIGQNLIPSLGALQLPNVNDLLTDVQNGIVNIASRISAGASALYATLLATADFINAGLISLPAYDISLFIDGLKQTIGGDPIQGLINAIGRPVAADVGMLATITVVQVAVWLEGLFAAVTGCGPAAPTAGLCVIPGVGP